jgi:hypothetical protein
MKEAKAAFDVLASVEKHIEALKPLLPRQALVCIGEYPIKTLLKETGIRKQGTLPILIEKSSDVIYRWLPKGYPVHYILGFEEFNIDTHFWYNSYPTIAKDNSVIESLKKKNVEKLQSAIIFSSIWDGIASAAVPVLISKFKNEDIDSLSIAILPSKIQPTDAHFNAYASIQLSLGTEGATILLLDRQRIEAYEGVDRKGDLIKGNVLANYLLNILLEKDVAVKEISELSRTFNIKLFTPLMVTGASYRIYGSFENMLNAALLKPFLTFEVSSASLLYVLLRMPLIMKDSLPRGKIELAITNWFKDKSNLQSIYITEPIYTEDVTDRIDAVLFLGGFDASKLMNDLEEKVLPLKTLAVEKGYITPDWKVILKVEPEAKEEEPTQPLEIPKEIPQPKETEESQVKISTTTIEAKKPIENKSNVSESTVAGTQASIEGPVVAEETKKIEDPEAVAKPKRLRRIRKTSAKKN